MNVEEARRIIDPNGTFANDDPTRLRAEGYLQCLEGPEVKALVGFIEALSVTKYGMMPDTMRGFANKALAAFREAVKP